MVADVFRRQGQHVRLVLAGRIAELVLEVGAGLLVALDEGLLVRRLRRREVFQHFVAGHKVVRQRFITVDVEEHVDARFVDLVFHAQHFRAGRQRWRHPFAVQVGACRIRAQVAANGAVRIHVRHDVEHGALQELARDRVGVVQQRVDQAFDEPFGHRFARMLARDDPDFLFRLRIANGNHVHVAAVNRAAQVGHARQRMLGHFAQQAQMAFPRIRLEVGVVHAVEFRRVRNRHHLAVEGRRHAEPVFAVVAGHGLVVFIAGRIGGLARVQEAHRARLATRALQAEVEPLVDVGMAVLAQVQVDGAGTGGAHHVDGARVEVLADFNGHVMIPSECKCSGVASWATAVALKNAV